MKDCKAKSTEKKANHDVLNSTSNHTLALHGKIVHKGAIRSIEAIVDSEGLFSFFGTVQSLTYSCLAANSSSSSFTSTNLASFPAPNASTGFILPPTTVGITAFPFFSAKPK